MDCSTPLSQEPAPPQLSQCMLVRHVVKAFRRLYIFPKKFSGHFASLSTRILLAPSVTQFSSHCALPPCALWPGRMNPAQPHQRGQHSPASPSPPASSPQTIARPNSQGGMSRLTLLCFARGWKETAARLTASLYPLIFSQHRLSDSHPNLEGQEYYSEKSFMAIA